MCSGCKPAVYTPAHSIASFGTKVKHKSKKAALCAAFLYDFARKAAQYVCRLPMDKAYIAMTMTVANIAHRSTLVNTKIQKRLHTFIGAAFRKALRRFTPALPHAPASGCHSAAAMPLLAAWSGRLVPPPALPYAINRQRVGIKMPIPLSRAWLTKCEFCMVAYGSQTKRTFCIIACFTCR